MNYIKVFLSDDEKKKIQSLASVDGVSISEYVKRMIRPALIDDSFSIKTEPKEVVRRDQLLKVYMSEQEMQSLKEKAGRKPLSKYAHDILMTGIRPVTIEVKTNDISQLAEEVSLPIEHFEHIINAMGYRKMLQPQEVEKMLDVLNEIRNVLKKTADYAYKNRSAIRSAGLRWLKKEFGRKEK